MARRPDDMTPPQLILHVGAGKSGSSALQTALSAAPDHVTRDGLKLRYTALRKRSRAWSVLLGRDLEFEAGISAYGYATWTNFRVTEVDPLEFLALNHVRNNGLRRGFVPIASCEGWITRPKTFARHLARWGYPTVDVVAYLRPPIEWINAAYWQWGIWHAKSFDSWLKRGGLNYNFGCDLEEWSQIPNVRLRIGRARPDTISKFAGWYGIDLTNLTSQSNTSTPASLIGFLLRNRRFRPNPHDSSIEFVFERWCPPIDGPPLWAVAPQQVHLLRGTTRRNLEALRRFVTDQQFSDLLDDPGWTSEKTYHPIILQGRTNLENLVEIAKLHDSLASGLQKASMVAYGCSPSFPERPQDSAPIVKWDDTIATLLEGLVEADLHIRRGAGRWSAPYLRRVFLGALDTIAVRSDGWAARGSNRRV